MDSTLATTPLHDWHRDHGARLVDFAGWSMPVQYTSITDEHLATRQRATLFDISHMGRFQFQGPGVLPWLEGLLTRRMSDLAPGRIRYSLVTRDDGGTLDDILVYRFADQPADVAAADQESSYLMVVNASNREKIWRWLVDHPAPQGTVVARDVTFDTAMVAVQGPLAVEIVTAVFQLPEWRTLKNYRGWRGMWQSHAVVCSRTGYTGEDGLELIVPSSVAVPIWDQLMRAGEAHGLVPAGLGARDTLRLEAAMPLYGHELSEAINPVQAGLEFAINLDDRRFPGHAALAAAQRQALPKRVGLQLNDKRVARQGAAVLSGQGEAIGEVTSGTFSPTLQRSIAMAYIDPAFSHPGTELRVDIRGREHAAAVVALPFYRRA